MNQYYRTEPVHVYRFDDEDAPPLSGEPDSLLTILKACLVTGYGKQKPLGFSLVFEEEHVKVFCPKPRGLEPQWLLRAGEDTGSQVSLQLYTEMTSINNGRIICAPASPYKYAKKNRTGEWLLVGSSRGFVFFNVCGYTDAINKGSFLVCGDSSKNAKGERAVYLHHTGGSWNDGDFYGIYPREFSAPSGITGCLARFDQNNNVISENVYPMCAIRPRLETAETHLAPLYIADNESIYLIAGVYLSSNTHAANSYDTVKHDDAQFIVHASSGRERCHEQLYVRTDFWYY